MENELDLYKELMSKQEELDFELAQYYNEDGNIPKIQHPLLYVLFHSEEQNAFVNYQFKLRVEKLGQFFEAKKWESYVFLHERPYRLNALNDVEEFCSNRQYWEILSSIWIDSENIWQNQEQWRDFLLSRRPGRKHFMEKDDREFFDRLPESFPIYRGYSSKGNKNGFSYSLDKEKAEWFASRWKRKGEKPFIKELIVKKKDVFAYLSSRNEKEIIYLK